MLDATRHELRKVLRRRQRVRNIQWRHIADAAKVNGEDLSFAVDDKVLRADVRWTKDQAIRWSNRH